MNFWTSYINSSSIKYFFLCFNQSQTNFAVVVLSSGQSSVSFNGDIQSWVMSQPSWNQSEISRFYLLKKKVCHWHPNSHLLTYKALLEAIKYDISCPPCGLHIHPEQNWRHWTALCQTLQPLVEPVWNLDTFNHWLFTTLEMLALVVVYTSPYMNLSPLLFFFFVFTFIYQEKYALMYISGLDLSYTSACVQRMFHSYEYQTLNVNTESRCKTIMEDNKEHDDSNTHICMHTSPCFLFVIHKQQICNTSICMWTLLNFLIVVSLQQVI